MSITTHYLITYCTRGGMVQAKHHRSVVGFTDCWQRILRPQPIWAVAYEIDTCGGRIDRQKLLKEYGSIT